MEADDNAIDVRTNALQRGAVATSALRHGEKPVDMGRLSRPEAEAFRYIAQSLGARFAGDAPRPPPDAGGAELRGTDARAGAEQGGLLQPTRPARQQQPQTAPRDFASAALLDRVPVAILVVVGDAVAFINRAAAGLFGYTSANTLDAAGGLGALFDGQDADQHSVLHMVAAGGLRFAAKVTMAVVDWDGARATLFTVVPSADVPQPRPPEPSPRPMQQRDPLDELLDANPDPVALVGRGGEVEACNAAFRNLAGDGAAVRLEDRVGPADLGHVFDAMHLASVLPDGAARTTRPVRAGADTFCVTVGALKDRRLSCLVFHKLHDPPPAARAAPAPANDRCDAAAGGATAFWRAVREVRRLVPDAAVLIVSDADERTGDRRAPATRDAEMQFLRLTLIGVASRAPAGAVLTVRRKTTGYVLTLSSPHGGAIRSAVASARVQALAAAAGLRLRLDGDGTLSLERDLPRETP